jgi:hypothetical protein
MIRTQDLKIYFSSGFMLIYVTIKFMMIYLFKKKKKVRDFQEQL